ncbi:hypothetical protein DERP_007176 [Dermatophagoides pteronyssinus]|uniref:Uncharacterized protein n=1 Tax=Dermatophagoides pteronyssinus TaxID=6956 RepID=A0ABQ8JVA7_DERPT|nr:hypothetical protein DERP_007176 [Dermatophagoides pteronyssinus]
MVYQLHEQDREILHQSFASIVQSIVHQFPHDRDNPYELPIFICGLSRLNTLAPPGPGGGGTDKDRIKLKFVALNTAKRLR